MRSGGYHSNSAGTQVGKGQPAKEFCLEPVFPLTYYDDVLGILETLLPRCIKDPAMEKAIRLVLAKRGPTGRWPNEQAVPTSKMWAKTEGKTKESKWNTYRALRVLKMWDEPG